MASPLVLLWVGGFMVAEWKSEFRNYAGITGSGHRSTYAAQFHDRERTALANGRGIPGEDRGRHRGKTGTIDKPYRTHTSTPGDITIKNLSFRYDPHSPKW